MNRYIVIAFAFLGVWFYEASGGADFEPGENSLVIFAEPQPFEPHTRPSVDLVARSNTLTPLRELVPATVPVLTAPEGEEKADPTAQVTLATLESPAAPSEPVIELAPAVELDVEPPKLEVVAPVRDLRFVNGDRVNMRGGPGTDYGVVAQLLRDDMVEILKDEGNGWLHLRDIISGQEGWMADWLVTAAN